ncbi:hypothetical protein KY345_05165 [Candidatus Woesearchaeota archaeon]|nr:hypothetical protein [Candidatus Woesearchaeota archaeon]
MKSQAIARKRTIIILVTIVLSIVLYLAGVYSGLYANRILEKKTEEDIKTLKRGTEEELQNLRDYIDFLETNQGRLLLEQEFEDTLTSEQMCDFSEISMNQLFDELNYYWQRFPFRLEEYEYKNKPLSEEYLALKKSYTQLSLRTWILAKTSYERCDTRLVHGINFYSTECADCAKQGEQIDKFGPALGEDGVDVLIFTIDLYSDEPIVKFLREYYEIDSTPALLLNDKVYQGRIFTAEELLEDIRASIK